MADIMDSLTVLNITEEQLRSLKSFGVCCIEMMGGNYTEKTHGKNFILKRKRYKALCEVCFVQLNEKDENIKLVGFKYRQEVNEKVN